MVENLHKREESLDSRLFFSLIIPVHNTESYIARCLESCINQTFRDIEIIIVDDCGNDNSMQIVQEYAKKDKRIKIIHNPKNLGLFHTRIAGENQAIGQYILHIDSDDFIRLDACSEIFNAIKKTYDQTGIYVDVCKFGTRIFPPPFRLKFSKGLKKKMENFLKKIFCKKQRPPRIKYFLQKDDLFLEIRNKWSWEMWGKAYRNDIVKKSDSLILEYLPNLPHLVLAEDALKFLILIVCSRNAIQINKRFYYYCMTCSVATRGIYGKEVSQKSLEKNVKDLDIVIKSFNVINNLSSSKGFFLYKKGLQKHLIGAKKFLLYRIASLKYKNGCRELSNYWTLFIGVLRYVRSFRFYLKFFVYVITFGRVK